MALIKMGVAVAQISGSISGTTFARNRGGAYMRNRTTGLNPQSTRQTAVRALLASLSNTWSTVLTQSARSGWEAYAATVPWTNRLGEQIFLTGQNRFVQANSILLAASVSLRVDPPDSLTAGPSFTPSLLVDPSDDTVDVVNFGSLDRTNDSGAFLLQSSPAQNPGVNFFKSPFRQFYATAVGAATPTIPVEDLPAAFPFAAGQAVFLRHAYCTDDGRVGVPVVQRFLAA